MPSYNVCTCPECSGGEPPSEPWFPEEESDSEPFDSDDLIQNWDYRPVPDFRGDGPLFLGMELELTADNVYGTARMATDYLGSLAYLKEDGSVSSGFEIVTHPMSYQYAMQDFPWDVLPALEEDGADTHDGTGIHVHVSRAGFSGVCHTYRWLKFFYRNQRNVEAFARRDTSQWARFAYGAREDILAAVKGKTGVLHYSRYQAVNVTNEDTFEVRVFRSSLRPNRVKAVLGFVHATVEYTRGLTARDIAQNGGWTWESFIGWVAQRPEYAPLMNELETLTCAY